MSRRVMERHGAKGSPTPPRRASTGRSRWLWRALFAIGWSGFLGLCVFFWLFLRGAESATPGIVRETVNRLIGPVVTAIEGNGFEPDFGPSLPRGMETKGSRREIEEIARKSFPGEQVSVESFDNPLLRRSSYPFGYQDMTRSELAALRKRMDLDAVARDARDELALFRRLNSRVRELTPHLEQSILDDSLPALDAFSILDAVDDGATLWCYPYSLVLVQCALSLGHQARLVSAGSTLPNQHAVVEVWSNAHGKWILLDPDYDLVYTKDGAPQSAYEMHRAAVAFDAAYHDWLFETGREDLRDRTHEETPYEPADDPMRSFASAHPEVLAPYEVVRGTVEEERIPRLLERSPTGKHIEAYRGVSFAMRNDYLTESYPAGHPRRRLGVAFTGAPPEWVRRNRDPFTGRIADVYWSINQVRMAFEPGAEAGVVKVHLGTYTPGFKAFRVWIDGKRRDGGERAYDWRLGPGPHSFSAAAVNVLDVVGQPSSVRLTIGAQDVATDQQPM